MRVAQRLGVLDVARVTAAVQGMPARHGKAGRVTDVVQPCGCFQEIGRRDAATHGEVCVLMRHGPGIEGVCGVDTAVTLSVNLSQPTSAHSGVPHAESPGLVVSVRYSDLTAPGLCGRQVQSSYGYPRL